MVVFFRCHILEQISRIAFDGMMIIVGGLADCCTTIRESDHLNLLQDGIKEDNSMGEKLPDRMDFQKRGYL